MNKNSKSNKLIIIGLDGFSQYLFKKLTSGGYFNTFENIASYNVFRVLNSTKPPLTPAAFATLQTGQTSYKHGVLDFANWSKTERKLIFNDSSTIKDISIWKYLSRIGKRIILFNVPLTYPPYPINGAMVSGIFAPNQYVNYTYPKHLKNELESTFSYKLPLPSYFKKNYSPTNIDDFVLFIKSVLLSKVESFLHLMKNYDYDIAFIHFQETDTIQHLLWHCLDENHIAYKENKFNFIGENIYKIIDDGIKRILKNHYNKYNINRTNILVFSDHGFIKHDERFYLRDWLFEKGYLNFRKKGRNQILKKRVEYKMKSIFKKIDPFNLYRFFHQSFKNKLKIASAEDLIDWKNTRIFSIGKNNWGGIFYNRDINEKEERQIVEELYSIQIPSLNQRLVKNVYKKRNLNITSDISDRIPDLLLEPQEGYSFSSTNEFIKGNRFEQIKMTDTHVGNHSNEGICLVDPSLIDSEKRKLNIIELPELILKSLMIDYEDFKASNVSDIVANSDTEDERRLIEKKLKDLGYM